MGDCDHCTRCTGGITIIMASAFGYWFQGLVGMILWLSFVSIVSLEEEDLADMGCGTKMIGCICKFFPILVRFLTFPMTLITLVIMFMSLVPHHVDWSDCHASTSFRNLA